MKKTTFAIALVVSLGVASQAHAAAYDWLFKLNDSVGDPYEFTVTGDGIHDSILMYRPGGQLPFLATMNGGLQLNESNQLVVDNIPQSEITGLAASLAGKASLVHTHSTSEINGLQSYVDGRIASTTSFQADWNTTATSSSSYVKNKPAFSYGTSTRSLNTAFQVSTTTATFVSYTVDVATTLSLTGGETGTVTLQYADDSGFTTNVKTVQSSANGNTGTLTIGLALTQTSTAALTGVVPASKWVRIATANTAGAPTFTYRAAQEVLMPF